MLLQNIFETDSCLDLGKIKNVSDNFISNIIKREVSNQFEEDYIEKFRELEAINEDIINNYSIKEIYEIYKTNDETDKKIKKNESNKDIQSNTFQNSNNDLTINSNLFNKININNKINNNNYIDINENIENKKENKLIGKKRKLFNITHPKDFNIFTKGGNDNYIGQLIKESLENNKDNFFS